MNEYSDHITWYDVMGFDGVEWHYVTDFRTREAADAYIQSEPIALEYYHAARSVRRRGTA